MWFIFALLTSLCYAAYYICNQNSKLNANIFIVYRGFIAALVILPFALCMAPSFAWQFFLIAAMQGMAVSYLDFNIYKLFQKYGAETVSSIQPLSVLITFIFWIVVRPAILVSYMENVERFALIVLSITAIVFAVMKYREQPFVLACLRALIPLLLIFSFIDVTNKLIMEYANNHLLSATIYRVLIVSSIVGFVNLGVCFKKGITTSELFNRKNVVRAWFVLLQPLSMMLVNFSVFHAENPAYTSAIIYLSVIWILVFNKVCQYLGLPVNYKQVARKWIILLIAATIVLILTTTK